MRSCTISYDIWPPRYRTLDESAIDIAISCNRYDHYCTVVVWQYVCVLLGFDFIVIDGDFPEKSVTESRRISILICMFICIYDSGF